MSVSVSEQGFGDVFADREITPVRKTHVGEVEFLGSLASLGISPSRARKAWDAFVEGGQKRAEHDRLVEAERQKAALTQGATKAHTSLEGGRFADFPGRIAVRRIDGSIVSDHGDSLLSDTVVDADTLPDAVRWAEAVAASSEEGIYPEEWRAAAELFAAGQLQFEA